MTQLDWFFNPKLSQLKISYKSTKIIAYRYEIPAYVDDDYLKLPNKRETEKYFQGS